MPANSRNNVAEPSCAKDVPCKAKFAGRTLSPKPKTLKSPERVREFPYRLQLVGRGGRG